MMDQRPFWMLRRAAGFVPALCVLLALAPLAGPPLAQGQGAKKTPSHVYQQAERLVREIQLLREAKGITTPAPDPGVQFAKLPLHVYAKGLEVMAKVAALQAANGMVPAQVGRVPQAQITPGMVLVSLNGVSSELAKVKQKMGISKAISDPPLVAGKIPADVYQNLWKASFGLDGLTPPLTPTHVFRNGQQLIGELKTIAAALGVPLGARPPLPPGKPGVVPKDVLLESYKNLYRVGRLERKIGLPPFTPPSFPIGKITPSDPFDATAMLLAELVRVKFKLGIRQNAAALPLPEKKTPGDVLVAVTEVGHLLNVLAAN